MSFEGMCFVEKVASVSGKIGFTPENSGTMF